MRGHDDALRRRLLRHPGVPHPERAALHRGRGDGLRQGVLFRAHVPRREVEDAPPPDRVLDDRARGRVRRSRRRHGARRGLPRRGRRSRRRRAPRRARDARARLGAARARAEAVSARALRGGARAARS